MQKQITRVDFEVRAYAVLNRDINRLLRETSVTLRDRLRTTLNAAAARTGYLYDASGRSSRRSVRKRARLDLGGRAGQEQLGACSFGDEVRGFK